MSATTVKPVVEAPVGAPTASKSIVTYSLFQNIFFCTLWMILELALIYFFTTIMIFSGLYTYVWSIQTVGLLAIIHLIAIPTAHFGITQDMPALAVLSLILCVIWLILCVVYIVVFLIHDFGKNDFKYRPLHHLVLGAYMLLDLAAIGMLSMYIVYELKTKKHIPVTPPIESTESTATKATAPGVANKSLKRTQLSAK